MLVGAEGEGSTAMRWARRRELRIPMQGPADSLNVTVAASIAMYHWLGRKARLTAPPRLVANSAWDHRRRTRRTVVCARRATNAERYSLLRSLVTPGQINAWPRCVRPTVDVACQEPARRLALDAPDLYTLSRLLPAELAPSGSNGVRPARRRGARRGVSRGERSTEPYLDSGVNRQGGSIPSCRCSCQVSEGAGITSMRMIGQQSYLRPQP